MEPCSVASNPFVSERLEYRAPDTNEDENKAFFKALALDYAGMQNVFAFLPRPASQKEFEEIIKSFHDTTLLRVLICLPASVSSSLSAQPVSAEIKDSGAAAKDEKPKATPIGWLHFTKLPSERLLHHRFTELAIAILPEYQGKGYGSEAIKWALGYAFIYAGLHKVEICSFSSNEGAGRLYQKLGFVLEGRRRKVFWSRGAWTDLLHMGMINTEWEALTGRKVER